MNRIHRAVRWRAGGTAFQLSLQMAVRAVLLAALLWAVMTLGLVWYWTGYYGGPDAHQYFGRWFLAWFFTQEVPLYFLSLPYRSGRYTIGSMYSFFNHRFYLGGSFAWWFWHYAPWGLLPTGSCLAVVALLLFRSEADLGDDQYVRGADVRPARRVRRELKGDGIELAGVRIPEALETQHFLITGAPGSGKSTAIRRMLRQIEGRGETAVVLDPECENVPEFYRPERGDLILNPLDARCPVWSPWWELRPGSEAMEAEALATALIPDPPNLFGQSGADFFFRQSARNLIVGLLEGLKSQEPAEIPRLLALPRAKLREALQATPAEALIDPGAHEQGAGIVATAFNATNSFRHLVRNGERSWSALEWADWARGGCFSPRPRTHARLLCHCKACGWIALCAG